MSSIKVWTSDGNWSASVNGCDKVHLIKEAILTECNIAKERCNGNWDLFSECSGEEYDVVESDTKDLLFECSSSVGLQINNKTINIYYLTDSKWNVDFKNIDFSNTYFFKTRLTTLREMAKKDKLVSALYNRLIECAKLPEKVAKNYCLLFMFSNE